MATIELKDAVLSFGEVKVFDGLSLELGDIETPSCIGLVGTNGSGKSTLANVLSGYYRLSAGSVTIDGHNTTKASPWKCAQLGIRRSFQNVSAISGISVREYVMLGWDSSWGRSVTAAALGTPGARKREREVDQMVREELQNADLGRYTDRALEGCPYGIRKLADLIRAMRCSPGKIAILDEPTSGVATSEKAFVADLILHSMRDMNYRLALVVDHDLGFVRSVCSELAVLEAGRVIKQASTDAALADPRVQASFSGGAHAA